MEKHRPTFNRLVYLPSFHCSTCGRQTAFVLSYFRWDWENNTWLPNGYWRHRPTGRV